MTRALLLVAALAAACGKADGGAGGGPPANPKDPNAHFTAKGAGAVKATPGGAAGRIEGRVTYEGAPPKETLGIGSDQHVCGTSQPDPAVEVADGGLVGAVVYVHGARGDVQPAPVVIDQKKCVYVPYQSVGVVGSPIAVGNSDPVLHNVHGYHNRSSAFNKATAGLGDVAKSTLEDPGLYELRCDVHPWMRGYVQVFEHPYFALADGAGRFSFAAPPPGKYELVVFHARLGEKRVPIEVTADQGVTVEAVYP